jgi:hypothetical protein
MAGKIYQINAIEFNANNLGTSPATTAVNLTVKVDVTDWVVVPGVTANL